MSKRGMPTGLYNLIADYGFVAAIVLAVWVWIKTHSIYLGLGVFVFVFLLLSVGLPVLDQRLKNGSSRYGKRTGSGSLVSSLANTALALGIILIFVIWGITGNFMYGAAASVIVIVLVMAGVLLYRQREKKKLLNSAEFDTDKICARCGYSMLVREGSRGKFWGCSTFPNCRYTESL